MKYKILVIDDEKMMCDLLRDHFETEDYHVITAQNSKESMDKLSVKPDIIIMDINMPGMDGISLCKAIRDHIDCPIVFLTAKVNEQDKINGFQAGGDDYITKPFSLGELSARVEAHLRREERSHTNSNIRFSHGLVINYSDRTIYVNELEIQLSKREFDIVELLSMNPKHVFDKEQIYEKIWGLDANGDNTVVKEHIRKIRMKLSDTIDTDFIETVWGVGYKWVT